MVNLVAPADRCSARWCWVVLLLCSVSACDKRVLEPPPPVANNEIVAAPPAARGAHAAFASARPLQVEQVPRAAPPDGEQEPEAEPDDAGIAPVTPAKPDGVAL